MIEEEITPIMAEYVADVFSRKEHLDNISYGYCMEIADVFRRYAERAEREQPEKPIQEGFSKEFDEYFLPKNSEQKGQWGFADIFSLARHFANWQKEQMLKDAVEGDVRHYATVCYVKTNEVQLAERLKQFQDGDKVKVIIVKEDGQ